MPNIYSLIELEELGYIQLGRGNIISKKDINSIKGDYPVYSSSQIGEGKFGEYGKYMFDEELITWSVDGGGKLFHRSKHKFSITNVTGFVRILNKNKINYKFLYYSLSLLHSKIKFDWVKKAHPSTLRKEYNNILLPSLNEQINVVKKIEKIILEIDNLSIATETSLNNTKVIFKNFLSKILKNKNEEWLKKKLKEITSKIGSGATPRGGKESYKTSGISLIRSMNVYDYGFKYDKLAYIDDEQAKKLNNVIIKQDDVLINISGASVARCCLVPDDVLPARVNQHVSILRVNEKVIDPELLHYILISNYHKEQLLKVGKAGGTTREAITKGQLQEYSIHFPKDLISQSKLKKSIKKIQSLSLNLEKSYMNKLNKLIELKHSILRNILTEKNLRC